VAVRLARGAGLRAPASDYGAMLHKKKRIRPMLLLNRSTNTRPLASPGAVCLEHPNKRYVHGLFSVPQSMLHRIDQA